MLLVCNVFILKILQSIILVYHMIYIPMANKEITNRDLKVSDKTFNDYEVKELSIFTKTFNNCIFERIQFVKCDFGKVCSSIVNFTTCISSLVLRFQ
jgi:hypothetical protein